jgi:hypothetical protein
MVPAKEFARIQPRCVVQVFQIGNLVNQVVAFHKVADFTGLTDCLRRHRYSTSLFAGRLAPAR